jgi:NADPH:quinone reductase-like Zn-dependent oxidoreductase
LRARDTAEKATIVAAVRRHVLPLIEAGKLRIVVDRTLPIQRAADAHRAVENSEHVGKVLLTVGG